MNKNKKGLKIFFVFILVLTIATYSVQIIDIIKYPSHISIYQGETKDIDIIFPFTVDILSNNKENILHFKENNTEDKLKLSFKNSYRVGTLKNGEGKLKFKLLGLIPIKEINVNVSENIYLVPGGNTIGVRLNTKGVLVVALSDDIIGKNGDKYSPAIDAGIKIGDVILSIDGKKVRDADHVIEILNNIKKKKVKVTVERNKLQFVTEIYPVKSPSDSCYRLGIWVRDRTAGIGTMTFYHSDTRKFGALGHGITDIDTGGLMPIENGEILNAKISAIEQGKKGAPGELIGLFYESDDGIGEITNNTDFGIYGTINKGFNHIINRKALPIASPSQVKEGKAYILSTIKNNDIKKYEIEIKSLKNQKFPHQKSMVIEVVDEELLKETGGIVQGMSGSPIIQNGKIIGAVTHVFVNNPAKGYGIYINWMLQKAGIFQDYTKNIVKAN
ncbi:SpoIVB peptidase [Dethiothermospora halolimnae]|uniref:SpoIVB peptidase n=1 Tax=Dethiothermospora halolimnae TaxID=3114390 RepID=UPI003CCC2D34